MPRGINAWIWSIQHEHSLSGHLRANREIKDLEALGSEQYPKKGGLVISNLRRICQHLASEHTFNSAIDNLALNACTSGKPSRIYVGRADEATGFVQLASSGFESTSISIDQYQYEFLPKFLDGALQKSQVRIIPHDHEYQSKFKKHVGEMDDTKWKATTFLTPSDSHLVAISSESKARKDDKSREYFETLNSILSIYLTSFKKMAQTGKGSHGNRADRYLGEKLTERQALILQLIRARHTNKVIADRMGYSESLIRQESVMIYKKLGVSGRKDLQE